MGEPVYGSVREFADTYGIPRQKMNHYIAIGVVKPRRTGGNSRLTETDMMRIARHNTRMREKKTRLTGR